MECGAPRCLFASTCTSQAYFGVRDSLFRDANDSKGPSAEPRRQSNHPQILLRGIFRVYELQKGGAERTHSMALEDSRYRCMSLVALSL